MSFIGDSLSSSSGSGFKAGAAPIASPTTIEQANATYGQSQDALAQQKAFLAALQGQNGIGNQSSVFNQLQGVANGTGPNPAQAMLAQQTSNNTANQAALMAGQRGAGSNTGLIARQAAQQGATNQQNAIGQGASMQANQSLNALNQLGGIAGQQVGQQANATGALTGATQNEQGLILNAIQGQNNANVGSMSSQNTANAGIAQGNQKFQQGLINGAGAALMAADGGEVPAYEGGEYVDAMPSEMAAAPKAAAPMVSPIAAPSIAPINAKASGPSSKAALFLKGSASGDSNSQAGVSAGNALGQGLKNLFSSSPQDPLSSVGTAGSPSIAGPDAMTGMAAAKGGSVRAMDDGGSMEKLLPLALMALARGGAIPTKPLDTSKPSKNLKGGGGVPGKAKMKGDNLKNDTVPAMLSPGEVVIPKSVMESSDPIGESAKFVRAIMAKQGLKRR